jgi:hypothetical protein
MIGELAERIGEAWENERAQRCLEEAIGAVNEIERVTDEMCNGKYGRAVGFQLRPLYHWNQGRAVVVIGYLAGIKDSPRDPENWGEYGMALGVTPRPKICQFTI